MKSNGLIISGQGKIGPTGIYEWAILKSAMISMLCKTIKGVKANIKTSCMVKTIEPEKKQSENQMPAIRWVKIWPKISGVFSLLALIVIILNSAVFSEYLTIPVWVSGDNGKSMSLVFSLI